MTSAVAVKMNIDLDNYMAACQGGSEESIWAHNAKLATLHYLSLLGYALCEIRWNLSSGPSEPAQPADSTMRVLEVVAAWRPTGRKGEEHPTVVCVCKSEVALGFILRWWR